MLMSIIAILITGGRASAKDNIAKNMCFPIEDATERLKVAGLKAERRDNIDSFLEAHFVDMKKRFLPMALYLKHDGIRDSFVVSESGEVENFHTKVLAASSQALICGLKREDGKIGIAISPSVQFIKKSGRHTMKDILDGLKDGKSHHKKNVGGAKAMFVPKMTHIAIVYDDVDVVPYVSSVTGGVRYPVELETYGEMQVIEVEALEESNAETIIIGGGPYKLFPVPSIKKMKSLGIN